MLPIIIPIPSDMSDVKLSSPMVRGELIYQNPSYLVNTLIGLLTSQEYLSRQESNLRRRHLILRFRQHP